MWIKFANWGESLPELVGSEWGHARDADTVALALQLRKALRALVDMINNPLPLAKHIKPTLICVWNWWKIGTDTYSRMMKNIEVYQESLSPDQCLVMRLIDSIFVQVFRFTGIIENHEWIQSPDFTDMRQFRSHINRISGSFRMCWFYAQEAVMDIKRVNLCYKGKNQRYVCLKWVCLEQTNPKAQLEWFDTKEGTTFRQSKINEVEHVMVHGDKGGCVMCRTYINPGVQRCGGTPLYYCNHCRVHLCIMKKGDDKSCMELWHEAKEGQLTSTITARKTKVQMARQAENENKQVILIL